MSEPEQNTTSATSRVEPEMLKGIWESLVKKASSKNLEFDTDLKIPVALGLNQGLPSMTILMEQRPEVIRGFESIDFIIADRSFDDTYKWSMILSLCDWNLQYAFAEMCSAIIDRISTAKSSREAMCRIMQVIDQWRRLLEIKSEVGKVEALTGFCAELMAGAYLSKILGIPVERVLNEWVGPYGAAQDFQFPDTDSAFEVKSRHRSSKTLMISSPEQLGDGKYKNLSLVVVELDGSSASSLETYSLNQIIENICNVSESPYQVRSLIREAADSVGINLDSDFVRQTYFRIGEITVYRVNEEFPKIRTSVVPSSVESLTYKLKLADLTPFIVNTYSGGAEVFATEEDEGWN